MAAPPAPSDGGAATESRAAADAAMQAPGPGHRMLMRIAAAGDSGTGQPPVYDTVRRMREVSASTPYAKVLLLGDLVYDKGDPRLVRERVLRPFAPLTRRGAELVPALGNHDYLMGRPDAIMRRLGRDRRYYVERDGPVRIVVLDSNRVTRTQTTWLRRTLRRQPKSLLWTIAIMHHPAYSAGQHGSDLEVRQAWSPLFARFNVPLVLAGHDHDYQRSYVTDGVTYVVSGGAAKTRPTGRASFTAVSASVLHFLDLRVFKDRIMARAVDQSGRAIDRFELRRR